ncbi:1-acyl-sn-glycerol-3-phosphate acyltransferase [Robiginitalea sp. SC105]|uniref:lysophospholipid acyltransferase family protein n=1 Tax=Robiginitalea sp. SC105 TaxID=2762332 RepID=UPI00163A228E|nr:lysophospholipid acyltransferase family protein [Robiginitalea sp. SC105]MBC2839840.1 1-acyl-sn-glycerol-3-phosphate acyltransferase [Robiginitalea sp. SC105]
MKIISTTWYILKLIAFCILGVFFFVLAAFIRLFDLWKAIRIFKSYLHLYFRFFGLKIHFEFEDSSIKTNGNMVFVLLNQSSFLDSLIVPTLPVHKLRGIINIEFALYPVLGWFLALANFVIIRQWSTQAKNTLNRANTFLQKGGNMVISIEGKRSRDGKLNVYKKGPVVMAIKSQSDIVPFIIEGTYQSLPYKSVYTKPAEIKVRVLRTIPTIGLTYEQRDELVDRLRFTAQANSLEW